MKKNLFFKPTQLHKEFMILDNIEKDSTITQRMLSKFIGSAVSMVNHYIEDLIIKGFIKKIKYSKKNVEYLITKKGIERRKILNIGYLDYTQKMYNSAKENIDQFIFQIIEKGIKKLVLYGAGGVSEILLNCIRKKELKIVALIDDDMNKVGSFYNGILIQRRSILSKIEFDGILVSTFNHKNEIIRKLRILKINESKIIDFFKWKL